eukprot:gene11378-3398_t
MKRRWGVLQVRYNTEQESRLVKKIRKITLGRTLTPPGAFGATLPDPAYLPVDCVWIMSVPHVEEHSCCHQPDRTAEPQGHLKQERWVPQQTAGVLGTWFRSLTKINALEQACTWDVQPRCTATHFFFSHSAFGLRLDGRRPAEFRTLVAQMGATAKDGVCSTGSCYVEMGNTKVLASVWGPREVPMFEDERSTQATLKCDVSIASFSTGRRT